MAEWGSRRRQGGSSATQNMYTCTYTASAWAAKSIGALDAASQCCCTAPTGNSYCKLLKPSPGSTHAWTIQLHSCLMLAWHCHSRTSCLPIQCSVTCLRHLMSLCHFAFAGSQHPFHYEVSGPVQISAHERHAGEESAHQAPHGGWRACA